MCFDGGMERETRQLKHRAARMMNLALAVEARDLPGIARQHRATAAEIAATALNQALAPKPAPPVDNDARIDEILTGLRAGL